MADTLRLTRNQLAVICHGDAESIRQFELLMSTVSGASGQSGDLQPLLGRTAVAAMCASGTSVNLQPTGAISASAAIVGTATVAAFSSSSLLGSSRRIRLTSTAAPASLAAWRIPASGFMLRGATSGLGGFRSITRFAVSDSAIVAGASLFVGLQESFAAPTDVDASALVNCVGIGADAGDTVYSIVHNDAAGVATKISLGTDFSLTTSDLMEIEISCTPNDNSVTWRAANLTTGKTKSSSITTNIPSADVRLQVNFFRSSRAAATAVAIDLSSVYWETPV